MTQFKLNPLCFGHMEEASVGFWHHFTVVMVVSGRMLDGETLENAAVTESGESFQRATGDKMHIHHVDVLNP